MFSQTCHPWNLQKVRKLRRKWKIWNGNSKSNAKVNSCIEMRAQTKAWWCFVIDIHLDKRTNLFYFISMESVPFLGCKFHRAGFLVLRCAVSASPASVHTTDFNDKFTIHQSWLSKGNWCTASDEPCLMAYLRLLKPKQISWGHRYTVGGWATQNERERVRERGGGEREGGGGGGGERERERERRERDRGSMQ